MQACDRCHARKTRCDRRIPRCGGCEKAGALCLHVDKLRSRNLPRGYVESVESALKKAEDHNLELERQIAALRGQLAENRNVTSTQPVVAMATTPGHDTTSPLNSQNENLDLHSSVLGNRTSSSAPLTSCHHQRGRTPADDAVVGEVGYLTLTAVGETRYLGASSGMGLANIIGSVLDPQNVDPNWIENSGNNIQSDVRSPQPSNTTPSEAPFPPRHIAMQIIEAYFQHTHLTFPLLHRPSFLAAVEEIYNNPNYYSMHPFDAFTFDMVLSIGGSNFNRFEESVADAARHYARARTKLNAVLKMGGLIPLHAITLLSQHGIFSNLRDTSASIWHLIGIGARICVELGLHLEPKRSNLQSGPGSALSVPITFEAEMRKRTFWCFYNLDRVVSFTLGRPVALRDEDISLSLPSHLEDEEFGPDRPIQLHTNSQHAQLYEEIMAWKEATSLLKLDQQVHQGSGYVSCFLTPAWYTAVANNALLLLYRPSPYLPYPVTPTNPETGESGDLQQLFSAAKASITSYYELHRKRRLNYSWITLHGIFIAGLAYVYGIGLALKDTTQRAPVPDYLDIINDTRACSNILVAICERWSVARSSCELFNRLSNAVIRDAVNEVAKKDNFSGGQGLPRPKSSTTGDAPVALSAFASTNTNNHIDSGHVQQDVPSTDQQGPRNYRSTSSTALPGFSDQFDHVFVAEEFRHFSNGFEFPPLGNQHLPSELVAGFSQDWPFNDASFSLQPGYSGFTPGEQEMLW
ncbi:Fungal Zn2-Cys6 binuclear cluster domain-containing protein [Cladophialophora immunda]|nr:Fungal Zn2-Cys6 binuclear cluster domain-containing protein [Cladophialophora immunda]